MQDRACPFIAQQHEKDKIAAVATFFMHGTALGGFEGRLASVNTIPSFVKFVTGIRSDSDKIGDQALPVLARTDDGSFALRPDKSLGVMTCMRGQHIGVPVVRGFTPDEGHHGVFRASYYNAVGKHSTALFSLEALEAVQDLFLPSHSDRANLLVEKFCGDPNSLLISQNAYLELYIGRRYISLLRDPSVKPLYEWLSSAVIAQEPTLRQMLRQ